MFTIMAIFVTVITWLLLYGICSLIIKFYKAKSYLKSCAIVGFCSGFISLVLLWLIFFINSQNSEQYEGTMWMLLLFGTPTSLIYHILSQFLIISTLCECLTLNILYLINGAILGISIGWVKTVIYNKRK